LKQIVGEMKALQGEKLWHGLSLRSLVPDRS
jgi:hypothetical protein